MHKYTDLYSYIKKIQQLGCVTNYKQTTFVFLCIIIHHNHQDLYHV